MVYKYNYFGDINNDFINALSKSIGALPKDAEGLFINISSCGGSVSSGVTAYNILKGLSIPVHTHNLGEVSSAAILPYLAGSTRTMEGIAKFMFHPFAISGGNMSYSEVIEKLKILESDLENYASIVKKEIPSFCKTHDIMDILKHQTLILTDNIECKRLGIITENPNNAIKV